MPAVVPTDTSAEVFAVLVGKWRAMSAAEKAVLVDALSIDTERLALAGIRSIWENPSVERERYELAVRRYGRPLARDVYGADGDR